ncbi:TetR/AcrR family transcriptional regulator [Aquamicrobium sp. LC103]|uniref:TetR/AcrR family transcriptional regulator n=1 Tax=Aquamicrobium sp. LC103 TaxID=1120658 RepID=UPI00063EB65D|nr:TetR/AcrR family transcriptional regulator [Aquamicrobium sp. LC103]TKT76123.1 TetR/AcrR family transcriptional regulator [Aquamicrobium sp. LC103]
MSRPRVINQDEILDAAEAVVLRDGAAKLTLDAVALEAGISKASVIYDYKTKQALIKAVIERRASAERDRLKLIIEALGCVQNACILGHIKAAASVISDETRSVGVNLCSALSQDTELTSGFQELCRQDIETILETSENPRSALLAFLAVEGLKLLEFIGVHSWPENERNEILREIEMLAKMPLKPPSREGPDT